MTLLDTFLHQGGLFKRVKRVKKWWCKVTSFSEFRARARLDRPAGPCDPVGDGKALYSYRQISRCKLHQRNALSGAMQYPAPGVLGVRGRPDFSRFDPRRGRPHFSNFGPPAERRPFCGAKTFL